MRNGSDKKNTTKKETSSAFDKMEDVDVKTVAASKLARAKANIANVKAVFKLLSAKA
jgi:hypothetical protein